MLQSWLFCPNTSVNEVTVLFGNGAWGGFAAPPDCIASVPVSFILIPSSSPCAADSFSDKNLFQFAGEVQACHYF